MTGKPDELKNQPCPMCRKKSVTLLEKDIEVPFFGKACIFSMNCESCKFHKSDIEAFEKKEPVKFTLDISSEEDLKIKIVKSSEATIKLPHITTIEPGTASNGYITTIEGVLNRVKHQIEVVRDAEEDKDAKKKAKNLLKKLQRVMWGQDKLKFILEDKSGNSAIISDKAVKGK